MFHLHVLSLDNMTASWLLPIVPAVVAAAAGGTVSAVLPPAHALTTLAVSYMLWGMGMGLSLMVIALYMHRLAVYKLPNVEVRIGFRSLLQCSYASFSSGQLLIVTLV